MSASVAIFVHYELISSGAIPSVRIGNFLRVPAEALKRLIDERSATGPSGGSGMNSAAISMTIDTDGRMRCSLLADSDREPSERESLAEAIAPALGYLREAVRATIAERDSANSRAAA